jgi:formate dehydrogenase major subunit
MMGDGRGWLFAPAGLRDGPLPAHYEPVESPVTNTVYSQQRNPTFKWWPRAGNQLATRHDPEYPYVATTYRLTELHTAGGMSRFTPWLSELQPEFFVEISPRLAGQVGVDNGDRVVISTPRAQVEARALVTERMQPLKLGEQVVETVGLPYHWGYSGVVKGDAANDLASMVGDSNVSIEEAKAFTCNLRKARTK